MKQKVFGMDGILAELNQFQAAMSRVHVIGPPEGAVAALVEAAQRAIAQLEERGDAPWTANVLAAALSRFEIDTDATEEGG